MAQGFHGSSCDPANSSHPDWLGNHRRYWFVCACGCKTFSPHPESVFVSSGLEKSLPAQHFQVPMPTWQRDTRGKNWRKISTHPRCGNKDPATMLSPTNLSVSPVPGFWGEKFSPLLLKAATLVMGAVSWVGCSTWWHLLLLPGIGGYWKPFSQLHTMGTRFVYITEATKSGFCFPNISRL